MVTYREEWWPPEMGVTFKLLKPDKDSLRIFLPSLVPEFPCEEANWSLSTLFDGRFPGYEDFPWCTGISGGTGSPGEFEPEIEPDPFGCEEAPMPTPTPDIFPPPFGEIVINLPGVPLGARPLALARIPAGDFQMGSRDDPSSDWSNPSEHPLHSVTIDYDFYLGRFEITQAQWQAVMGSNPSFFDICGDDCPVEQITWNDAQAFVAALNALVPGVEFRLPSEAEWEYACRAGTTTRFYFGDSDCSPLNCNPCELDSYAWWCGNTFSYTTRLVAQRLPNPFGLYDTGGNVWEWCQDRWHDTYAGAPSDGSAWETGDSPDRVLRGGGWESAAECRSAYRTSAPEGEAVFGGGLRVLLTE
jgi:formylglycine-generating enzyme required for sulfatase activity